MAVAAWLALPLGGLSGPRQWGVSVSSFPDGSGYGWNLALGRSDGDYGVGPGGGLAAERRGGMRNGRTSFDSARSGDGVSSAPDSAAIQQRQQSPSPDIQSSVPEQHGDTANPTAGLVRGPGLRSESAEGGSDRIEGYQGLGAAPYIAEASLQFPVGEGVHVIPGLVAVRQEGRLTLSLVARTQWFF